MSMPVDLDPRDFHYYKPTAELTIIGAALASQDNEEGEEVDVLAIRVRPKGAPRGSRATRTYVLPIGLELSQQLLEKMRDEL